MMMFSRTVSSRSSVSCCGTTPRRARIAALWRAHGRLPWPALVEPALELARRGVELPPAHASCLAMLAPVMTMNEGAEIYAPGGRLLEAGELLRQPGLVSALEAIAEQPSSVYTGSGAAELPALSRERGGLITAADLHAYEAEWSTPVGVPYLDSRLPTRGGTGRRPLFDDRGRRLHPADVPTIRATGVLAHRAAAGGLGVDRPAAEAADALDDHQLRCIVAGVPGHV